MRPGAGRITVVHDPYDDPDITHRALAASDPRRGTVTVHSTVGTTSPSMLALDLISALGYHGTGRLAGLHLTHSAANAFAAAAAWLVADDIQVVLVPHAHLLAEPARIWLGRLAVAAEVRVVPIWHGYRPDSWAEAFPLHPRHLISEADSLQPVLAGTPTPRRDTSPSPPAPTPTRIPTGGLASFRAEASRILPPEDFQALDAHYRHGMRAACRWITDHRLRPALAPPAEHSADQAGDLPPANLWCTAAPPLGRPQPFADKAGMQAFLCAIALAADAPSAAVARIRGAQAALFLHGLLLAPPPDLATAAGPGLSTTPFTAVTAQAIRAGVANPALAFAVAVAAFTGARPDCLGPIVLRDHTLAAKPVIDVVFRPQSRRDMYPVPDSTTGLLRAALHYQRLSGSHSPDLALGIDRTDIAQAADGLGLVPARYTRLDQRPWHLRTSCWHVGPPLHVPAPRHPGPTTEQRS